MTLRFDSAKDIRDHYPNLSILESNIVLMRISGYKNYEIAKMYKVSLRTIQYKLKEICTKVSDDNCTF